MDKKTMIAIFLASAALCAGAGMQTLESDAIIARADTATGEVISYAERPRSPSP